ncbi:MAG: EthD family reductase [Actinobacteria bacterium]|nr:EthD family reductase [Actinomycetota bacterium]
MSAAYLVVYEGKPEEPEEFLRYYLDVHVPIIWTWPGVERVEVQRGIDGGDFFMVARFTFPSPDALRAALESEGRERARKDRESFPPFHGTIRHQAVDVVDTPRP